MLVHTPLNRDKQHEHLTLIYKRLTEEWLLARCESGKTQNANQCLHSLIWSHCAKDNFASWTSWRQVHFAVLQAVLEFNFGASAAHGTARFFGFSPGANMKRLAARRVSKRLSNSLKNQKDKQSKRCDAVQAAWQKRLEELLEFEGGPAYVAGWVMSFHPEKCQALHVTRKRKPQKGTYHLHGQDLKTTEKWSTWVSPSPKTLAGTPTVPTSPRKQIRPFSFFIGIWKLAQYPSKSEPTKPLSDQSLITPALRGIPTLPKTSAELREYNAEPPAGWWTVIASQPVWSRCTPNSSGPHSRIVGGSQDWQPSTNTTKGRLPSTHYIAWPSNHQQEPPASPIRRHTYFLLARPLTGRSPSFPAPSVNGTVFHQRQ